MPLEKGMNPFFLSLPPAMGRTEMILVEQTGCDMPGTFSGTTPLLTSMQFKQAASSISRTTNKLTIFCI